MKKCERELSYVRYHIYTVYNARYIDSSFRVDRFNFSSEPEVLTIIEESNKVTNLYRDCVTNFYKLPKPHKFTDKLDSSKHSDEVLEGKVHYWKLRRIQINICYGQALLLSSIVAPLIKLIYKFNNKCSKGVIQYYKNKRNE